MTAEEFMRIAIEEAKKGEGATDPNPLVGAVIVRDGRVLSKDFHHKYGEFHAERNAILNCRESVEGADIYVTLEPCCHQGKTPPCTSIIIDSGIKRVFIGSHDPNPLVSGKGAQLLRDSGIEVTEGVLREECDRLNPVFFHYITHNTPYVVMKYAMTADGKIASCTGRSKWISCESSRNDVQRLRNKYMAIMVGVNTVLADDPLLTCRIENGRDPVRIICDSRLRIPCDSAVIKTAGNVRTIIACTENAGSEKAALLESMGAEIVRTGGRDGKVDLKQLMNILYDKGINSVLLEGGGELNFSALKSGIVNKITAYISPKILGGSEAPSPVRGTGFDDPEVCVRLGEPSFRRIENDVLIEWEVTG